MIGFKIPALLLIASCIKHYWSSSHLPMRKVAVENDASRSILPVLAFALTIVIRAAVGSQRASATKTSGSDIAVTILTLLMSFWAGSALSTSNTNITSPSIRHIATGHHGTAACVFNVGVFALTVNLLAGRN